MMLHDETVVEAEEMDLLRLEGLPGRRGALQHAARAWLGVPIDELTDRRIPLADIDPRLAGPVADTERLFREIGAPLRAAAIARELSNVSAAPE